MGTEVNSPITMADTMTMNRMRIVMLKALICTTKGCGCGLGRTDPRVMLDDPLE